MNTADSPQSWLGQRLGDQQRYKLIQQLGGGGIGEVYLAIDTRLGYRVAVKLLKGTLIESREVLARFEREIILSAALESEHIVQVLDYGIVAGKHPFYVMEYLQGQPLSDLISRSTRLSPELVVHIAIQICAGLKVAHEGVVLWREDEANSEKVKVIHRDLKPANIFLVPTATGFLVKVLDFGIAKKLHTVQQSNPTIETQAFLGTSRYAPPEQFANAPSLDERADLYSLGMMLYEMLSGTDPFGVSQLPVQQREIAWRIAHYTGQPVPLRQQPACAQIPVELEAIVMRCLERRASNRFGSAVELLQALHTLPAAAGKEMQLFPPLSAAGIEATVIKPLDSSLPPTVPKPLLPDDSTPEATIVQALSHSASPQPNASHSSKKVTVSGSPDQPAATESTIAQLPSELAKQESGNPVPAQSVNPDTPHTKHCEETMGQIFISSQHQDGTIAQVRPHSLDETNVQRLRHPVNHQDRSTEVQRAEQNSNPYINETVTRMPQFFSSLSFLGLAKLTARPSALDRQVDGQGRSVLHQSLNSSWLLLAVGFLMGLLTMAGLYVLLRSSQLPRHQQPSGAAYLPSLKGLEKIS